MTGPFLIEELSSEHGRREFASGVEALDRYLIERATQDVRRNIASCFVARTSQSSRVIGYYTLAMGGALLSELPPETTRKLPKYASIPAARIGRLAVDIHFRGRGLGSTLLVNAISRVARSEVAAFAVLVDAKDEAAAAFYRHHGFESLVGERLRLFLPVGAVRQQLRHE